MDIFVRGIINCLDRDMIYKSIRLNDLYVEYLWRSNKLF